MKGGNPKGWIFDLETYNTAPIDPAKFAPQCQTRCLGQCQTLN